MGRPRDTCRWPWSGLEAIGVGGAAGAGASVRAWQRLRRGAGGVRSGSFRGLRGADSEAQAGRRMAGRGSSVASSSSVRQWRGVVEARSREQGCWAGFYRRARERSRGWARHKGGRRSQDRVAAGSRQGRGGRHGVGLLRLASSSSASAIALGRGKSRGRGPVDGLSGAQPLVA
jgi:hypothetical protein